LEAIAMRDMNTFQKISHLFPFLCGGKDMIREGSLPRSNSCGDGGENFSLSGPLK